MNDEEVKSGWDYFHYIYFTLIAVVYWMLIGEPDFRPKQERKPRNVERYLYYNA